MLKPEGLHVEGRSGWGASALVGMTGGIIGGFTAFPGAAVVVWSGLRRLPKAQSRSIVQPYILGLQLVSLAMLAIERPETFSPTYWALLLITVPSCSPVRCWVSISTSRFLTSTSGASPSCCSGLQAWGCSSRRPARSRWWPPPRRRLPVRRALLVPRRSVGGARACWLYRR